MHSRRPAADALKLDLRGLKQNLARDADAVAASLLGADMRAVVAMAPNAVEWVVGREWCNAPETYEFQRSYQVIRDFFQLRCPTCNKGDPDLWLKPRSVLESEVLLVWSWDALDYVCPKCRTAQAEFIESGKLKALNQLHGVVGQRAGKSITGALIGTYIEHATLSLAHLYPGGLHAYLDGMSPSVKFELTFVASNQVQTEDTIWALYTGFRERSPWFQRYGEWIKTQERFQVVRAGQKLWRYIEHQKVIVNEHPNVRLNIKALNSNSNGQAGRTRVGALIDEMARMKRTASAFGADEIYATLEASLQTVRSRARLSGGLPWLGPMVSVTSPMSRTDRAWTLLKQAEDIPGMMAVHYATWDFNPKEPRSGFEVLMRKDPVLTMRNFGAQPPGAEHPFIHDEASFVQLAVDRDAVPTASFAYFEKTVVTGQRYIGVRLKNTRVSLEDPTPRYLVFDAGLNFDAFTGVCAHRETSLDEDGTEVHRTRFDWLFRIVPQPGTEALFGSVTELVRNLRKAYRIARVEFDRWNSAQPIQDINEMGIVADSASLKKGDFQAFRLAAFSGQIRMLPPPPEEVRLDAEGAWRLPLEWKVRQSVMSPAGVAIAEICELQQDPDTQVVYNPQKGEVRGEHSDDLARICVHAHRLVQTATFARPGEQSRDARRRRVEASGNRFEGRLVRIPGKSRR